jgi:hypothetical protein
VNEVSSPRTVLNKPINDRYGRSLERLLHELKWAISERNAYNELCRLTPYSLDFFSYALVAINNDMISHTIKALDKHKDTSSFFYIYRCEPKKVTKELKSRELSISEIETLAEKIKTVRDKTHFHIDKDRVFSPKDVWKEANIKGKEFNKVIEGIWFALSALYEEHFSEPFYQLIYDAGDIEPLLNLVEKSGIKV